MLQKPKNWLAEALWKPKKTHSLEQLRYLHYILQRNSTVTEGNKALLVETLRSIAEILIWGDQNDSTVFDFFLEKNMLLFFLKIMTQNCGSYVTVQLLQTLNILFENIKNETSLYFLLSNNHVNSIIVHKFDFSNEEVLAYYISFLKTLSLKLNNQTINFFFNERKSDFPLYTEAIKFFHHQESMVRIAVRTLTLNVCRVGHKKMLEFICDKTATPYFSNLIWLIGKDAIELDDCVVQETDHFKFDKLKASVADHLDHLHYLNDILELKISVLNIILTDHMINRLLIPLYIYSLPMKDDFNQKDPDRVRISKLVALFLLSQHLLIMRHPPLVNSIVDVIFNEDNIRTTAYTPANPLSEDQKSLLSNTSSSSRAFIPPPAPLESQLEAYGVTKDSYNLSNKLKLLSSEKNPKNINSTFYVDNDGTIQVIDDPNLSDKDSEQGSSDFHSFTGDEQSFELTEFNNTKTNEKEKLPLMKDEGKDNIVNSIHDSEDSGTIQASLQELQLDEGKTDSTEEIFLDSHEELPIVSTEEFRRIFVVNILKSLDCSDEDGEGFFALCLFYSILTNTGIDQELLKEIGLASPSVTEEYNEDIMEQLLVFLEQGVKDGSKMRLVTFEMCVKVIRLMIVDGDVRRTVKDRHYAMLQNILESSTLQLRNFYKGDELFVHTFEGEYHHMKAKPLNVEYVAMDASLLLPATVTPLTGIDFLKRLPCGDDERTQRASHVFILTRELMMDLKNEQEYYLPLSKVTNPVKESEVLDLNNSDLIACTIIQQNKQSTRRFLVIDTSQFILVEPDTRKLGWGLVKFVSHLQDVEASPDKDDSRSLHIVVQQPFSRRSKSGYNPLPILTAKFIFDDYIRCMTARQRLQKRRDALRHRKMTTIATLLELPALAAPPAQFYSIASYDGTPTSVWSPSSRGYSSTRQSPNTSTNNLSLPSMPINTNKSKLLSPKHEEILQKKMNKQTVSDDNNDFTAQHTMSLESPSVSTPQKNIADSLASILQTSPSPNFPEINGQATLRSRSETMEIGEEVGEDNVTLSQNNSSYVLLNDTVSVQRENTKTENENQLTNQLKRSSKIITDKTIIEEKKLSDKKRSNSASVGTNKKLDVTNIEESVVSDKKRSTSVTVATNKKLDTDAVEDKKLSNKKRSNSATKKLDVTTTEENLVSDKKRSSSSSEASQSESNSSSELKKCDSAPGSPSGRRKARFDTSNENADRLCKSLPAMAFVSPVATSTDERKQRAQRARAKAKVVKTKVRKTRK